MSACLSAGASAGTWHPPRTAPTRAAHETQELRMIIRPSENRDPRPSQPGTNHLRRNSRLHYVAIAATCRPAGNIPVSAGWRACGGPVAGRWRCAVRLFSLPCAHRIPEHRKGDIMQLTPDAAKIRRWREERHWSQEHLADLAGIGLRTVQRIETGNPASRETLMALAAAFNVDVIALTVDAKTEAAAIVRREQDRKLSALRLTFWINLACYALGVIVFAGISLGVGNGTFVMLWPLIWWTVGVAGHGLAVVLVELVTRYERQAGAAE